MGIPKFARFIITRYPLVLQRVKEEIDVPNIDYLYLDLNGIIHVMSHNNSTDKMASERSNDEIFYDVFNYIDQLMHLVKPNKVLMLSIDGVAPRAKMNQQRCRRFKKTNIDPVQLEQLSKQGVDLKTLFNSDCISPGTEFMHDLHLAFDFFISKKISEDPLWTKIKVIYSGTDVPGEGEHKILDYIRKYKDSSNYDENSSHCIYGLDADLIMLGLVTHMPNVCILREETILNRKKKTSAGFRGTVKYQDSFEFIHLSLLREYLGLEFLEVKDKLKFEFNVERIIDDFLFICFFIGNDFLPSLNTLDIDEGSLDKIFEIYKDTLPQQSDYLTFHGKINFSNTELFFSRLAKNELDNLKSKLKKLELRCKERDERREKLLEEKRILMTKSKLNEKKRKKLKQVEELPADEKAVYKKKLYTSRVKKIRDQYALEVKRLEGEQVSSRRIFEEDLKKYLNSEPLFTSSRKNTQVQGNLNPNDSKKEDDVRNLMVLFEDNSSDEEKKAKTPKVSNADEEHKSLYKILKEASSYSNFIFNEDTKLSELRYEDFNESDVSKISDFEIDDADLDLDEGFTKDMIQIQDIDKEFQQKLISLYVSNINDAKALYYKEKVNLDLTTEDGKSAKNKMFKNYLEGLQWVLFYYYRGIPSWDWFYPFHYPPMISDFDNIKSSINYDILAAFNFDSKACLPFQSLLMMLPETSKNLLPAAYHSIYDKYPEFYPKDFKIDFNGKHLPWEALVIIPFVDISKIIDFEIKTRESSISNETNTENKPMLKDKELLRNQLGKTYIYTHSQNSNHKPEIQSFLVFESSEFPVEKKEYILLTKDLKTDLDRNYQSKKVSYLFPTLYTADFQYFFDKIPDYRKTMNRRKRNVLTINPISSFQRLDESLIITRIGNALYSGYCYINYPYKNLAKVVSIIYHDKIYYLTKDGHLKWDPFLLSEDIKYSCKSLLSKRGIYIELFNSHIYCEVVPFKQLTRSQNGKVISLFKTNERYYTPVEVTSINSASRDYENFHMFYQNFYGVYNKPESEFFNSTSPNNNGQLLKGLECIVLTKSNYCELASSIELITNRDPKYYEYNTLNYSSRMYDSHVNYDLSDKDWKVDLKHIYSGPLIKVNLNTDSSNDQAISNKIQDILYKTNDYYISMEDLSKQLKLTTWTLSLLTSCIYIVDCNIEDNINDDDPIVNFHHWNLGLNLKSSKGQKLILPGYTRFKNANESNSSNWEFSSKAVNMIIDYLKNFPFIIDSLNKFTSSNSRSGKFFKTFEFFADYIAENNIKSISHKLNEVSSWVNSQKSSKMSFVNFSSCFISSSDVGTILKLVNAQTKSNEVKEVPLVLNPGYLISSKLPFVRRFLHMEPFPFQLGDRVINIRADNPKNIPFGLKGTVTGVLDDCMIEVLFDRPFFGGSSCGERLPQFYGAYVNDLDLLNITNRSPVFLRRNKEIFWSWNYEYIDNQRAYSQSNYNQNERRLRHSKPSNDYLELKTEDLSFNKLQSENVTSTNRKSSYSQEYSKYKENEDLNKRNNQGRTVEDQYYKIMNIDIDKQYKDKVESNVNYYNQTHSQSTRPAYKKRDDGDFKPKTIVKRTDNPNYLNKSDKESTSKNESGYNNTRLFHDEVNLGKHEFYLFTANVEDPTHLKHAKILKQ